MQNQPTRAGAPGAWTTRVRLFAGLAVATTLLAACSSDTKAAVSDAAAEVSSGDEREAEGAGDDAGESEGSEGSEGAESSDKLPGWALALLVVVAVVAVVGLILGFQNRGARRTEEAAEEGYRRGQQDSYDGGRTDL